MPVIVALLVACLHDVTAPALPSKGPPLVCHQLEIGTAASLPWKSKPFGFDPNLPLERVPDETVALLRDSADAVVHMETLRRAYIYLRFGRSEDRLRELGSLLKDRILHADLKEVEHAGRGYRPSVLAWFDLGYLMAIIENNGGPRLIAGSSSARVLELVNVTTPLRADVHFGIGYALDGNNPGSGRRNLEFAALLTSDAESLVAKNLIETQQHRWPGESRPDWDSMRRILLGMRADGADTRPDDSVICVRFASDRDPAPMLLVGTVTGLCERVVVLRLSPASVTETRPDPVAAGCRLDVISADRQTYVGRIEVLGRSGDVATGLLKVVNSGFREPKSGDLVVAGL
jgi:hypothetical protein